MNAIELHGVSKDYRRVSRRRAFGTLKSALLGGGLTRALTPEESFPALREVTLAVARGESLGVIGANGSGKSTLLKLVAGIGKPSRGRIEVHGRISALLELGAGFHPEISGRENVIINGMMLGLSRREIVARMDRIVAFAGLEAHIEEPVKNYSSGMYVRLGFAVAVHTDPEILLVDEVLAVGDEEFSHRCLERIRDMQRSGTTILFVTHALGQVVALCHRAAWLEAGTLRAIGDPREVIDRYRLAVAHHEAAHLVAAAPAESASNDLPPRESLDATSALASREPKRWGDGRVEILSVRLLDAAGRPATALPAGRPVEIELRVRAARPLDDVVFGFALFDRQATWILGTNSDLEGFRTRHLEGEALVRIRLESLDLPPGDYELDVAAHAKDGAPYDYIRVARRFAVEAISREVGVWRAKREWRFEGGLVID